MTESINGRGLLTPQELAEAGPPEAVRLPLELVDANPSNPRRVLTEVDALAANIARFGLMQPIFVRRQGERYEVLAGHRRRAAFLALREHEPFDERWRTIPAVVVSADDETAGYMLISAQAHIVNWKPREQAAALERLALTGMTLREIGERVNRSEGWASKRLRVFSDSVLSGYVQSGQLTTGVAEELLILSDVAVRKEFADRAVVEVWSQDHARAQVRALAVDRQLGELARKARELVNLLSIVDGRKISIQTFRDLAVLSGRISVLAAQARGEAPRMPTIEEAQQAAGVRSQERPLKRGARRKPGYKPRP